MERDGHVADADLMHPKAARIPPPDDPALLPHYARMRRLWYVARYSPVVALGGVVVSPLPTPVAVVLVFALPLVILTLAAWMGLAQESSAAPAGRRRALVVQLARGHLNLCLWALGICMMGIWAAALVIPLVIVCLSSARVKSASVLDTTRLPALCRAIVETTPGVRVLAAPDRPGCPNVFVHRDAIYLSQQILSAEGDRLTIPLAREVAHMRLGHRGMSPAAAVQMAVATAIAWLTAVSLGALSLSYHLPLSGFAPAWSALAAATFGLSVGLAATDPIMLRQGRLRERSADGLALQLTGDGVAYANWLWSQSRANAEPLWPTRLHTVVAWTHPATGERIERALAYGSRPPTPSLLPAGGGGTAWLDQHRHAVLAGAWAWLLVIAWVLGKLHPGGLIH